MGSFWGGNINKNISLRKLDKILSLWISMKKFSDLRVFHFAYFTCKKGSREEHRGNH